MQRFLAFRRAQGAPVPLEALTVRARGLEFAVRLSPPRDDAPPLLCINGGLLFGHQLLWPALAPLAQRRRLILYDQRGRGQTPAPPGVRAARIAHDAADVPALRLALGIERWDVLGHSWGGGIAMLAVASDAAATRALTLINAVGATSGWLPPLHALALAKLPEPERGRLAAFDPAQLLVPDPAVHLAYHRAFYPAWFSDLDMGRRLAPPHALSVTGATIAARLRGEGYDWRETLQGLDVPTLLLHGSDDLIPPGTADATAALLPRARRVNVPQAGHLPFFEAPEHTFAAIEDFLGSVG